MKKTILLPLVSMFIMGSANAAVIFSGTDGSLDFETASGNHTLSGIQVTLSANDGIVNGTGSGLGINDSGSSDDTDGLDTINLTEALTVSFDVDVIFNSMTFSDMGANDAVDLSFGGNAPITVSASGQHTYDTLLLAGQTLIITAAEPNSPTANNGVTINQFTVTAVPEPASSVIMGLGGFMIILRRRR